jgi:integrase
MPRTHLTDITLRALKVDAGQVDYWDVKTPGFGVRVGKHSKTFIVKCNNQRITIGQYSDQLSLQEARRRALGLKSEVGRSEQNVPRFSEALESFFEVHLPTLKPRTQQEIRRTLNRHFLPELKSKRLDEITHRDVSQITIKLLETPSEAWHAFKDIRTFFNWCVPAYIAHSPCAGLKAPTRYVPRKRVLTYDEIEAIWKVVNDVEYPFSQIVKLLILTGCRYGEVVGLRWSCIDEKKRAITLPETKNRDAHNFPYGRLVARVLETVPRLKSTDLLFPGRDNEKPWNGAGKAKWELDKHCKIDAWQLLDCRRTFGTKLAELRVPPHIIERLLNHKLGTLANQTSGTITAVAEVYNRHHYLDEMREAIHKWEKRLNSLLRA